MHCISNVCPAKKIPAIPNLVLVLSLRGCVNHRPHGSQVVSVAGGSTVAVGIFSNGQVESWGALVNFESVVDLIMDYGSSQRLWLFDGRGIRNLQRQG